MPVVRIVAFIPFVQFDCKLVTIDNNWQTKLTVLVRLSKTIYNCFTTLCSRCMHFISLCIISCSSLFMITLLSFALALCGCSIALFVLDQWISLKVIFSALSAWVLWVSLWISVVAFSVIVYESLSLSSFYYSLQCDVGLAQHAMCKWVEQTV